MPLTGNKIAFFEKKSSFRHEIRSRIVKIFLLPDLIIPDIEIYFNETLFQEEIIYGYDRSKRLY